LSSVASAEATAAEVFSAAASAADAVLESEVVSEDGRQRGVATEIGAATGVLGLVSPSEKPGTA
jgi:hypothetical protein